MNEWSICGICVNVCACMRVCRKHVFALDRWSRSNGLNGVGRLDCNR